MSCYRVSSFSRLAAVLLLGLTSMMQAADEPGFQSLFNGKSLDGWELFNGKGPGYIVQDGSIVCPADGGGNLFTRDEYANFVLRFEFKLKPESNNGIGIRAPIQGDVAYSGMEIQVLDDTADKYRGWLKPAQYHGSIYSVVAAKPCCRKPVGEWNEQEIMADGRRVKVTLNGTVIMDANLDDIKDPEILKKHPGLQRTSGRIGLLGHGSHVEFRNLRVKRLP